MTAERSPMMEFFQCLRRACTAATQRHAPIAVNRIIISLSHESNDMGECRGGRAARGSLVHSTHLLGDVFSSFLKQDHLFLFRLHAVIVLLDVCREVEHQRFHYGSSILDLAA